MTASELTAQAGRLRAEVASHKAVIRRHREQLGTAAAQLRDLEATCRRLGIALILKPSGAEEEQSSWPAVPHQS